MGSVSIQGQSAAAPAIVGVVIFLVILGAGLLLGTESSLTLSRDASGRVDAVNAWRLAGKVTLLRRSVSGLRDARVQEASLTMQERRSGVHRNAFGQFVTPEELVLIGDTTVAYPYREDLSLIRSFLRNHQAGRSVVTHPTDVRRHVASWVLLVFAAFIVIGWIVRLALGRDPLAHLPDRVTPLPAPVGAVVVLAAFAGLAWFFAAGHLVFGSEARSKVDLLMASAAANDPNGVRAAADRGVFLDIRDGQGMTALMIAARADAANAIAALLGRGANPGLIDFNDNTALMWAISMGKRHAAARLLEAPVDVEATDTNGRGPLYLAAREGEPAWVAQLLSAGAKVNAADAHGWTPLMAAATSGSLDTVRLLLSAGADSKRRLPDNRTAVDLAANDDVRNAILAR
jgi:hypothetical protein